MTISLAVWIQYTNVTDRQTDTRRQQRPRLRIASRGKNVAELTVKRNAESETFPASLPANRRIFNFVINYAGFRIYREYCRYGTHVFAVGPIHQNWQRLHNLIYYPIKFYRLLHVARTISFISFSAEISRNSADLTDKSCGVTITACDVQCGSLFGRFAAAH